MTIIIGFALGCAIGDKLAAFRNRKGSALDAFLLAIFVVGATLNIIVAAGGAA